MRGYNDHLARLGVNLTALEGVRGWLYLNLMPQEWWRSIALQGRFVIAGLAAVLQGIDLMKCAGWVREPSGFIDMRSWGRSGV